jgi:hypothetical protein
MRERMADAQKMWALRQLPSVQVNSKKQHPF